MNNKLCFTTSLDEKFIPGAMGLINSIRKFYTAEQADIIVYIDKKPPDFEKFCSESNAELFAFDTIEPWVMEMIYADAKYKDNANHYYHPAFKMPEKISFQVDTKRETGFHKIHHLHPLNVKAYCTAFCILIRNYSRVVHVDCDAFLLSPIDEIFDTHHEQDSIIAFADVIDDLDNLEYLYGVNKPRGWDKRAFGFNAGIVFYRNGPRVKELIKDFCFFIDSCHHFDRSGHIGDQGILRSLAAVHSFTGNIKCFCLPSENWNPLKEDGDNLLFDKEKNIWINMKNMEKQHMWHAAGRVKIWSGKYSSPSALAAWDWVNGKPVEDRFLTPWKPFTESEHTTASDRLRGAIRSIVSKEYNYIRVGYDSRPITFLPDGKIGRGSAGMEKFWNVREEGNLINLEIHSGEVKTCCLKNEGNNIWKGQWNYFEKMPVELIPL